MTLFTLLLVLACERLCKQGEHWQLDHYLAAAFKCLHRFSLLRTLLLTLLWVAIIWSLLWLVKGMLFGVIALLLWIAIGVLCIGSGSKRKHYRAYLNAAGQGDADACTQMAEELALVHGLPTVCSREDQLCELQNALLWINYRYYLAPLFWLVACGPVALAGYAFLRAYQTWLVQRGSPLQRSQAGIEFVLHWLDWVPVRLAGIAYVLMGHGEKAMPAWFASLGDLHSSPYQVLTRLAQFSLARDPQNDPLKTPVAAVALASKVTVIIVVIVALLTIYGALM